MCLQNTYHVPSSMLIVSLGLQEILQQPYEAGTAISTPNLKTRKLLLSNLPELASDIASVQTQTV